MKLARQVFKRWVWPFVMAMTVITLFTRIVLTFPWSRVAEVLIVGTLATLILITMEEYLERKDDKRT